MDTKPRAKQTRPVRAEVKAAWERIRLAAGSGDIQASALLIALTEHRPLIRADIAQL
ncbi:hypothetical protein [Metapseudomonas otitidis]|uniref:hypothetical protein n=1 Tax=Metapseudomonas otitidis TaxID=319939 RepID=UPI001552E212|nr:hypothetical protein [Pseudomonas otitidis]